MTISVEICMARWCMWCRFYEQYLALRARIKAFSCPTLHRCNAATPTHINATTRSASLRETHRYMSHASSQCYSFYLYNTNYIYVNQFTDNGHVYTVRPNATW